MASIFETLNSINVNEKTEQKNGLTYLSWAWAWAEVKKRYPNANYTIYERQTDFGPVNYFTDGMTCWVKTGVTIEGLEHIEELPVMDFRNKSIPADKVTSFDVNKSIQRSLTKALARHGLGLYIFAGEDLPEENPAEVVKKYNDLKRELAELGCDFEDPNVIEYIQKEAKVEKVDVDVMDVENTKRQIKVFEVMIKKKKKNNDSNPNEDVRNFIRANNVNFWQVAAVLGLTDSGFSKKLRKELPQSEKDRIFKIVKEIEIENK